MSSYLHDAPVSSTCAALSRITTWKGTEDRAIAVQRERAIGILREQEAGSKTADVCRTATRSLRLRTLQPGAPSPSAPPPTPLDRCDNLYSRHRRRHTPRIVPRTSTLHPLIVRQLSPGRHNAGPTPYPTGCLRHSTPGSLRSRLPFTDRSRKT